MGLWHGANWNFIFWGFLHGIFLSCNYFWINCKKRLNLDWLDKVIFYRVFCRIFTFLCVTFSFIFFRSDGLDSGLNFLSNFYVNINNILVFDETLIFNYGKNTHFLFLFFSAILLVNFFPNTQELSYSFAPKLNIYRNEISNLKLSIATTRKKAFVAAIIISLIYLNLSQLININEYIYFRF